MRNSEWQIKPEDSANDFITALRHGRRLQWYRWPVFVLTCLTLAYLTLRSKFPAMATILTFAWARHFLLRYRPLPATVALGEIPDGVPQFAVDTVFYCDKEYYGEDSGVIAFVDDWMVFTGSRCSFNVHGGDVKASLKRAHFHYGPDSRFHFWFDWKWSRGMTYSVGIRPIETIGTGSDIDDEDEDVFLAAFNAWRATAFSKSAQGVFPPVTPHPLGWYRCRLAIYSSVASLVASIFLANRRQWIIETLSIPTTRLGSRIPSTCFALALLSAYLLWLFYNRRKTLLQMNKVVPVKTSPEMELSTPNAEGFGTTAKYITFTDHANAGEKDVVAVDQTAR